MELIAEMRTVLVENPEERERIRSLVFRLSVRLIKHSDFKPQKSALLYFAGILGYDDQRRTFRSPQNYTPYLSQLQYCMRIVLFEHSLATEGRDWLSMNDSINPLELIRSTRDTWLVVGQPTPFNQIHTLLQYGMHVAKESGGKEQVLWMSDRQTMIFNGRPLEIRQLRTFIHSLVSTATTMVIELMFGDRGMLDRLDLNALRDDLNLANLGYSFVRETENQLSNGRSNMMDRLKKPELWDTFIMNEGDGLVFQPDATHQYLQKVESMLEIILALIHLTSGQPARGTELTSLRYVNTLQSTRNIFISDGYIMTVTEYHKSQNMMDEPKVIPRFLPHAVGVLLVIYLSEILPFIQLFDYTHDLLSTNGFLFVKDSVPWPTQRLTDVLSKESSERIGFKLNTQDYRHIAAAIDRQHIRGLTSMDEENIEEDAHDLQAAHSSHIAERIYGVRTDLLKSLNSRSISTFRDVSQRLHLFLKLESRRSINTRKKRTIDELEPTLLKRRCTEDEMDALLKRFFADNHT